jgi:hypothetical protein
MVGHPGAGERGGGAVPGGVTPEDARRLALALPEAVEADHHGRPSFRVAGRIFASVPEPGILNVMLGEDEARPIAQEDPAAFELLLWGKRVSGIRVSLDRVSAQILGELLFEAWERRAPRRLTEP